MNPKMFVSEIFIYPIKSCKGISVSSALDEETGFQYDRLWMVVDENMKFMTQRQFPIMVQIIVDMRRQNNKTKVWEDSVKVECGRM